MAFEICIATIWLMVLDFTNNPDKELAKSTYLDSQFKLSEVENIKETEEHVKKVTIL